MLKNDELVSAVPPPLFRGEARLVQIYQDSTFFGRSIKINYVTV